MALNYRFALNRTHPVHLDILLTDSQAFLHTGLTSVTHIGENVVFLHMVF